MNDQNGLIDLRTRTPEQRREIARAGGLARTPAKKFSAKLRELRKKGITSETCRQLVAMLEDPELSALNILGYIEELRNDKTMSNKMRVEICSVLISAHRSIFGDSVRRTQLNMNMNLNSKKLSLMQIQAIMRNDDVIPDYEPDDVEEDDKE